MAAGGAIERDAGLNAAIAAVGSLGALARALGVKRQSLQWRRVPQRRLFEVARVAGMDPVTLRPDLADWISVERSRRRMALARERFSLVKAAAGAFAQTPPSFEDELAIGMLTALAAARFVAGARGLTLPGVMLGRDRDAAAARALAMALAHVAGRASSPAVGAFFGVTRQNVDNASERYLRARDGDDVDDVVATGRDGAARVIERGRVRRAKAADEDLWALERDFLATLQAPTPERKRG